MTTIKRVQFDPPNRIEVFYTNGDSSEWIQAISDISYQELLDKLQSDIDSGVGVNPIPNWGGFMIGVFVNPGYQQIRASTINQIQAQQLELSVSTIASGGIAFNAELFFPLWNTLITGLQSTPEKSTIDQWVAIAQANNMPFTFNDSGNMIGV